MKDRKVISYEDRRMAEGFLAQAQLCEHIASACANEETAQKFKALALECKEAASAAVCA